MLAAYVEEGCAAFSLPERISDLFFGKLRFLHDPSWVLEGQILADF